MRFDLTFIYTVSVLLVQFTRDEIYFYFKSTDTWDCVATCFFIDTANNVLEYIETIWKILKPGGVWINLGEFQVFFYFIL